MRLTSSIRLLAMAVLLAAPAAASASPPAVTHVVEPLAVTATVTDRVVAPATAPVAMYNATLAQAMALISSVRTASHADSANAGVQASGALRRVAARADVSQRMRPSPSDSVATVTSRVLAVVLTTRTEPPNRRMAERNRSLDALRQRL